MFSQQPGGQKQPVQGRHTEFNGSDSFRFLCHRGLECFNRCCRDINIFLSPYDVLRLSRKLGLKTGEFLTRYTIRLQPGGGFPVVLIKMREDHDLQCPFLTGPGCSVYGERPWSCRMAPVEIRGGGRYGFAFDSDHCRGLLETREWTVEEWMKNQGNDNYRELEAGFKDIPDRLRLTGLSSLDSHIRETFFMACYDVDRFRRYVLESSFTRAFNVDQAAEESIRADDRALLRFGFHWLADGFDLRRSMAIRDEVFRPVRPNI